jgi:hypothetical protein
MSTKAQRHMGRVAELPCAVCGESPVEVHHLIEGRTPGRRSSDWLTIPLCVSCHRDNHNGIHGQKRMWSVMRKNEHDCLAETLERLYG